MPKIPPLDLSVQTRRLLPQLLQTCRRVFIDGHYILGPSVQRLEGEIAREHGRRHGIGVASGTDALRLACRVAGLGPGDGAITTPFTFVATAEAISDTGARPFFVDVDPVTFNLDPAGVQKFVNRECRLTSGRLVHRRTGTKIKALIAVHLYGQPCDMDALRKICRRYKLYLIEDCAQSYGARWNKRATGGWGDLACFSFFPTKNLAGFGDGGLILTDRADWADRLRRLRAHGSARKYFYEEFGANSRLDELQASLLLVKRKYVHRWNLRRRALASLYTRLILRDKKLVQWVVPPMGPAQAYSVYHLYSVRVSASRRKHVVGELARHGITATTHYPLPLHLQKVYHPLGYRPGQFPQAEEAAQTVVNLPIWPEMAPSQVRQVVRLLSKI